MPQEVTPAAGGRGAPHSISSPPFPDCARLRRFITLRPCISRDFSINWQWSWATVRRLLSRSHVGAARFNRNTSRRNGRAIASPTSVTSSSKSRSTSTRRTISGTATHRLSAITGPLDRLEFDAAELEIKAVRVGGEPATFETADDKLKIAMPRALGAGEEIEVAIDYASQPRRGLYFVGPDAGYPNKPRKRGRRARTRIRATGFHATTIRTAGPPARLSRRCRKNSPRFPTAL